MSRSAEDSPQEWSMETPPRWRRCRSGEVGIVVEGAEWGLVAIRPLGTGEKVLVLDGEYRERASQHSLQVEEGRHLDVGEGVGEGEILERYYWRFLNHGCEPNTMIRGREVVALRAIEFGEEVTFNYNTTEYELAAPFDCRCGSALCLGRIRGFAHLPGAERERLRPWLAPHLLRCLEGGRVEGGWREVAVFA